MIDALIVFVAQTVTASVPLVLAALGGALSERSGVATIALEGYILGGAFGATVGALATGSVFFALVAALLAGAFLGAMFTVSTVKLGAHSIVSGVAINLFAAAATRVALKVLYDSASNSPPILALAPRTGSLARVALVEALGQPVAWLAPIAVVGVAWTLGRSVVGLRIHAVGENPEASRTRGISVGRVRAGALIAGGALAALGGAHIALNQHEFVAYMSGGRGFLAIAAVILGGWNPLRASAWAVGIGALAALEATLAGRIAVPSAVLQALPYAVTLVAVVGLVGRTRPPAALGSV